MLIEMTPTAYVLKFLTSYIRTNAIGEPVARVYKECLNFVL
jgi:hypothetical protein